MADYGLTPKGPNIKRLDVILDEMHEDLSKRWGVNTKQNPESFVNHLLTNIADKIAELWEFGENVYHSQYPSTAEGVSLDNAAQYGGSTREVAAKSYYPIHCTGIDGTVLVAGTAISSVTNPATHLSITEDRTITRTAFNKAVIKKASDVMSDVYTIAINGDVYSVSTQSQNAVEILKSLKEAVVNDKFELSVNEEEAMLSIEAVDITSTNVLVLSENLTTETVTTIITFGTEETGNILVPEKAITNIVRADAGLHSVINLCTYIAGRDVETDAEFRISYADKIFNRSSRMLESIRSAILQNVQGVVSVAPYENPTNVYDDFGRPPHSIEIVVDGGDSVEIAQQIWNEKAGGICTYGDTTVVIAGAYDEDITVSFSRPRFVYTWFHLGITLSKTEPIPPNYVDLLRAVILENMEAHEAGKDVIPQQFVTELHNACCGISYIDVRIFATENQADTPDSYPDRSVEITARQRAFTTEEMIEVEIDG